jgi:potassium voltage-gated channel Eag-related subfamily H protein 7
MNQPLSQNSVFTTSSDRSKTGALCGHVSWIIDPRTTRYLPLWDVLMVLALLFTATVTPYELSFLPEPDTNARLGQADGSPNLFIANRIIDLLFMIDVLLCFRLMYYDRRTGQWVSSPKRIANHYLRGWFTVDFLSVLPFYLLPWLTGDGYSALGGFARFIRLLRFLRLARIFKAQRILHRALQDVLMGCLELTYSSLTLLQMVLALLLWSHWQACL